MFKIYDPFSLDFEFLIYNRIDLLNMQVMTGGFGPSGKNELIKTVAGDPVTCGELEKLTEAYFLNRYSSKVKDAFGKAVKAEFARAIESRRRSPRHTSNNMVGIPDIPICFPI